MANLERIRKASRRLELACLVLTVISPLTVISYWAFFDYLPPEARAMVHTAAASPDYPPIWSNQLLAIVVTLLPTAAVVYGLSALIRLLRLYQAGRIFSLENVACFRKLGRSMIMLAGASFLSNPLLSLALTFNWPPGRRMVTLGLSSNQILALLVGGVILLISWVMDEGRLLAEDNAMIV